MATFLAFDDGDQDDVAFPSSISYQSLKRAWQLLYQSDVIEESTALYRELVEERRELGFETCDFTTRMQLENLSIDLQPKLLQIALDWDQQAENAAREHVRAQIGA